MGSDRMNDEDDYEVSYPKSVVMGWIAERDALRERLREAAAEVSGLQRQLKARDSAINLRAIRAEVRLEEAERLLGDLLILFIGTVEDMTVLGMRLVDDPNPTRAIVDRIRAFLSEHP